MFSLIGVIYTNWYTPEQYNLDFYIPQRNPNNKKYNYNAFPKNIIFFLLWY